MHLEGTQEVREVVLKVYAGVPMCMSWAVAKAAGMNYSPPAWVSDRLAFGLNVKSRIENVVLALPLLLLLLLVVH